MEIYRGYIIMAIGVAVVLVAIIGFIAMTLVYHKKKDRLMNGTYEE
ncbi:MAG: hypothetical protein MJ093_03410 [Saccharofermentans sp.]|nr:hypothetical protein [Saccharofermentans sp.]